MIRTTIRVAAACLALATPLAGADEVKFDLRQWIDGPVRYIARKEEAVGFKALTKEEDRALFIERFWARRDPTPDSLTNEYRQLFWERVQEANSNFIDSSKPGWMTDRGKIHILHGPPSEVQSDPHLSTGNPTSGRGIIRWIYEGRPSERVDMDPIVVVPFERDVSGEYRLSYDPKLASVFWDPTAIHEKRDEMVDKFIALASSPSTSRLSVMLDLGRMQEVPPQSQVLLESVETLETYLTAPLNVTVDRFQHPDEGGTLAVVNVDLGEVGAGSQPTIVARFTPLDASQRTRMLGEDSFRIEEREDYRLAQGRLVLPAGDYALTVMVADPHQARSGLHRSSVRIDTAPQTLKLSDVVLALELQPLSYAALVSYDEPFQVGPFELLPKTKPVYRRGDPVRLFYEVYGADFPLQVSYQVEGLEEDDRWVQLGRPAASEQVGHAQAWELPTTPRWPLGRYRIRIEVVDAAGRGVTVDAPFELVDG